MSKTTETQTTIIEISPEKFHCVIFDMDGVVTQTAEVHSIAWKKMFDDFLQNYSKKNNTPFVPFDADQDYNLYVDGKPRLDGIRSFLKSRQINLPEGSKEDGDDKETIFGLATKKNNYFLKHIQEEGVKPYQSTIDLIEQLKNMGVKVGIITSSKNCKTILEGAGALNLFDIRIDGLYAEKHGIKGKPAPDIFLEAAKQLGEDPSHCIVIEDAISGVEAGSKGNFGLVIGVDRVGQEDELLHHGATVVVKDLSEVKVSEAQSKPNALEHFDDIIKQVTRKQIIIFLDYDGTLTPIVSKPDLALIPHEAFLTLDRLSQKFIVSIISGRDLSTIKKLVKLKNVFYAGSHGFDIETPNGEKYHIDEAKDFIQSLDDAEKELREKLSYINGALIERKKYGVAAHYRLVEDENEEKFKKIVEEVHQNHLNLRKTTGKKVLELLPKIDWNKGKALLWFRNCLKLNDNNTIIPIFIGDDKTDEDGFKVVSNYGIGICVQETPNPTLAKYVLKDTNEVREFLDKLIGESEQ